MRYYEIIIIVHPNVPEEELPLLLDKITSFIKQHKGEVVKLDQWGKRKCAHKIDKCVKGYYFVLSFEANPALVAELEKMLRYDEKVLRYQTVRVEKKRTEVPSINSEQQGEAVAAPQSEVQAADQ